MPIYEYRCDSCGYELEALQKLSDEPLQSCPACEAAALRRLISAPSFRLKGDGWYENDFKSDKETKRNLVDSGATGTKDDQKIKSTDSDKDSKKSDSKSKDTKSSDSSAKKDSNAESK